RHRYLHSFPTRRSSDLLKDDKTYPWIVIKNEAFPRIFWTRRVIKDGSKYFGPYASLGMMHAILNVIKEIFPIRTCNLKLSDEARSEEHTSELQSRENLV